MNHTAQTIVIDRRDLFTAMKHGFQPTEIGSLWVTGWAFADDCSAMRDAGMSVRPA